MSQKTQPGIVEKSKTAEKTSARRLEPHKPWNLRTPATMEGWKDGAAGLETQTTTASKPERLGRPLPESTLRDGETTQPA
ncbi:hypothetical protein [Ottowia sp.]|uniref:hypothetical protein n=1 Tax=Ottowia sp. TaxID=1898956 RepID=UPI0025E66649|nr:hypothetical protein [Ottowia sp.]MBK6616218.1 hypothetical protein [Ottowia sp.]